MRKEREGSEHITLFSSGQDGIDAVGNSNMSSTPSLTFPNVACETVPVAHAPRHFRSFEAQTTSDGCFSRQSVCLVISLESGMSRLVHPQREVLRVVVEH